MRLAQTSIMIAALLTSATLFAAQEREELSVAEINNQISTIESQYRSARDERHKLESELSAARERLAETREQSDVIERERRATLEQMNRRYRELVDDPTVDISEAQQAYQDAVRHEQSNAQRVADLSREVADLRVSAEQLQVREHSMQNQLATFNERLQIARVERVLSEFNARNQLRVDQEVTCERDETIAQCENRADLLAKQRASRSFLTGAFETLTESSQAAKNREAVTPDVRIVGSRPLSGGFSGGRQYQVSLEVELQGRITRPEVCSLLEIDPRYCADNIQAASEGASDSGKKPADESVLHRVLVRSNVFDDQVIINGDRYGSTPVEAMLQTGQYDVTVSRRGYTTNSTRLDVSRSQTYRVDLQRLTYDFSPGEIIQDAVGERGEGPAMIVVPSGNTRLGNLQRNSGDEQSVRNFEMAVPAAFSVTPITVAQFRVFVQDTGYVTTAEQGSGCRFLDDNGINSDSARSWESPGYEIADNFPVTCVSLQDAERYTRWLSRSTGQVYRLPSEDEWEYAARAGTNTHYWWGNSIGSGRANCVTCGTRRASEGPSPVHSFERNPFGLADTVGNVWEWTVAASSDAAVARGGAYNFAPVLARANAKLELFPAFNANYVGFRVLREES